MTNTKKTIEVEIGDELLCDLVENALECGGIRYWARSYGTLDGKDPRSTLLAGNGIRIFVKDSPGDLPVVLDLAGLRAGIAKILALPRNHRWWNCRQHVMALLSENDDAETADVLVQWAVFGEVIYG